MPIHQLTFLDRLLANAGHALETVFGTPPAHRPSPANAANIEDQPLNDAECRHAAGLMRVNHTGEVCAQALYLGQAIFARRPATREHLWIAAAEETDHLAWCAERIAELGGRPSRFNPLWFGGSFGIGMLAALAGDNISLGFVMETEDQVEAHLVRHLQQLPAPDLRSRAIVMQMREDEALHSLSAQQRGGVKPPAPLPKLMALTSKLMTTVAYRI